jgi:hypothetical protein
MKDETELTLFQKTLEGEDKLLIDLQNLLDGSIKKILGNPKSISIKDEKSKAIIKPENKILHAVANDFSYHWYYPGGHSLDFYRDKGKNQIAFFITLKKNNPVDIKEYLQLLREIAAIFTFTTFGVEDRTKSSNVVRQLHKINPEESSYANYYYAAGLFWIEIYPPIELRRKTYLPLPDSFYLNIPAYKVEKYEKNSIFVMETEDLDASVDEIVERDKRILHYYKEELSKLGLWGTVKWGVDWKDKYRDFLREKGFIV